MSRKKRKKTPDSADNIIEQDERFAYIAGYTSGGFPYGVTWEEEEEINKKGFLGLIQCPETEKTLVSTNRSGEFDGNHSFADVDVFELPF